MVSVPAQPLRRGRQQGRPVGFPRPRRKFQHDAFRLTGSIHVRGRQVQLPRLGAIRLKEQPAVRGRILSATVSREADRWFVSLAVAMEIRKVAAPKPLSRKQRGSRNRRKSAQRLARLHRRIKNIRLDFLHLLSTHLAKTKRVVVLEDLHVSGMLRNRRLARHIADVGWSAFRRMLAYKCVWYGSSLVVANRFYPSSKTCSACGHVLEQLPLHVREWTCPSCGTRHDREVNAARNLAALAG